MDYEAITQYLVAKGYDARQETVDDAGCVTVRIDVCGLQVELVHFERKEFSELPHFLLRDCDQYGTVAHVLEIDRSGYGHICVGDRDSISVNYEQPHLAVEASLQRHIELISKAIEDAEWNEQELVREFLSNWNTILSGSDPRLILAAKEKHLELMQVFNPAKGKKFGYGSYHLGITEHAAELSELSDIDPTSTSSRSLAGDGYVIPLGALSPPPVSRDDLAAWYLRAISTLPSDEFSKLEKLVSRRRSRSFWVVFNGDTTSGTAWFGVILKPKGKGKRTLPIKSTALTDWSIKPTRLTVFNKKGFSRVGGNTSLSEKSVLLVGCGSVGGEIAYKLASSGVGNLFLIDPDVYSLENLYRHVLDDWLVGAGKAFGLSMTIQSKYPWTKCKHDTSRLLDLRHKAVLESFDLVVIAIGSPTQERLFHDFLIENNVSIPVINTWVEGYGVGGHATLDLPNSKGCLRCAYVDQSDLSRGLASNLNFLEANQDVTVNHAGCGELFLPYGAINAAQTAVIASDLAIHLLNGTILKSCKVSWKGDDVEALEAGLSTTHRYQAFNKSLQHLPLYDENCDICNDN
ncbi:MAG: ThiF family adenylyltransferase [Candidatus Sedimenticola sp. (ex Thyasira tokunagai)]